MSNQTQRKVRARSVRRSAADKKRLDESGKLLALGLANLRQQRQM